MRYLLDTQVFYWLVQAGHSVPTGLQDTLSNPDVTLLVSDVSAYEVGLKVWLGKFDQARSLADTWATSVAQMRAVSLPVNTRHALTGARLDWEHRDPFDRLIVAQAVIEDCVLVTADRAMLLAPDVQLLRW